MALATSVSGPQATSQPILELGRRSDLRSAAEGEGERLVLNEHARGAPGRRLEPEVGEDLVAQQGEAAFRAQAGQERELFALQVRAGGVVRAHGDQRARPRPHRLPERFAVQVPLAVVAERIASGDGGLQRGEVAEERIAGLGDQHLVTGVAQELEEVGVRLAGRRGDHDAVERGLQAAGGVVARNSRSRELVPERVGTVERREFVGEGLHEARRWKAQLHGGGVRLREVEEWLATGSPARNGLGERVGRRVPSRAVREHHGCAPEPSIDA
ncbi:MAG: hypothetical protein QM765_48925 [Myxococcales bacterium]